MVMTYRAPNREIYSFHMADTGFAAPRVSEHPDTTLVVAAPGYRRRTLRAADLRVTRGNDDADSRRVELDPAPEVRRRIAASHVACHHNAAMLSDFYF